MKTVRFMDWPLRVKMAMLLLVASLFPLALTALRGIRGTQERLLSNTTALLTARGDQLVGQLDGFNRAYIRAVDAIARCPDVVRFFQAPAGEAAARMIAVRAALDVYPATDPSVRGVALLDLSGTVRVATEEPLAGKELAYHAYVQEALRGAAVVSDIHLAEPEAGEVPTIAYLAPVLGPDRRMIGLSAVWVRATALWDIARSLNGLAGPDSFAVLFDHQGIRIAHSYSKDIVFHPGGPLDASTLSAQVAERRFGERTRQMLEDIRSFPEQFERARSESADRMAFRGFAPVNQRWNYGVGRRMETAPWTLFYMVPQGSIDAEVGKMIGEEILLASLIMVGAAGVGALFAAIILRPVRSLAAATRALTKGDRSARVVVDHADELGQLGAGFNQMAEQIEAQAAALEKARDELEMRVEQRTAELARTTRDLALEVDVRKRAEVALRGRHEVILRQQQAIAELSTPVLRLRRGLLILPLIGLVDTTRVRQINERLLPAIADHRARVVVIDITGVAVVDAQVADHLLMTVRAVGLMGASVIITGLSAAVAQALVNLDVDFGSLVTRSDLQGGIESAERLLGYQIRHEGHEMGARLMAMVVRRARAQP